jgi:pimeloyl-ACP methyl ester carboxylesterase
MAPTVQLARAGQLAPAAAAIFADPAASRGLLEVGYEDPAFLSAELVQAFLEPVIGSAEAAERFQELISSLGPADLVTAEPALRNLRVPTLIAWGTDDEFFDLTLIRDVDSVIVELAPLSDPTWIGELRDQSRTLSSSQSGRITAAIAALRRVLTTEPANV